MVEIELKLGEEMAPSDVLHFLSLKQCEKTNVLVADWSGVLTAEIARAGCNAILSCLEGNNFVKILNNNQQVTGHYPGAIEWVGQVWFPSIYTLGIRYFAWVYSPEFYTQIGTDQVVKLSSKVQIQTFYSLNDACIWLLQQPDSPAVPEMQESNSQ